MACTFHIPHSLAGDTMVRFFVILNEIIMRIVVIVMWYSPFGIMSLIIGEFVVTQHTLKCDLSTRC